MELNKELFRKIISEPLLSRQAIAAKYCIGEREAGYYNFIHQNLNELSSFFESDAELIEASVRYKKQKQRFEDINRVERKSFREYARVENAVAEYAQQLVDVFDKNPYKTVGVLHQSSGETVGVIQLSDVHFNELISLQTNKYDFTIASQRLQKYANEAKTYFKSYGVTDVFVLFSADLLNSDRRLDEVLAMATNRSKATFIAVQILENFLVDLNQDFNLYIAGVVGNESRVGKDYNWNTEIISDNYDFVIFNILRYKLNGVEGISFLGLSDKHEEIVEINGKNFLLIHGHQIGKDLYKDISKLIRKYAQMGIRVDYVIFGHIHESLLSDTYARSASLCGSNNYSEDALLLVSRSSQNLYLVFKNNRIDSIRVDLQDTTGYLGYDTKDWADAYNPKSVAKARKHETILRITI